MSETATTSAAPVTESIPLDRIEGLKQNWKTDMTSGFILFLIALPLSLAIAQASGFPPIAGIFAAITGSLICSQFAPSHVVINGPAAGLIVVMASAVDRLGGGTQGYHYCLAAVVVAGALLFIGGLFKAGELGHFFPSSVIHGMLAAIGLTIIIKQVPLMLGAPVPAKETLLCAAKFPEMVMNANPEIAIIGLLSLVLLIIHANIKSKAVKSVPAPIVVVAFAMLLGLLFQLDHQHHYEMCNHVFDILPNKTLVQVPLKLSDAIAFPDWSAMTNGALAGAFWFSAISICLVQGIESLLTAAAVSEKVDPWRRPVDLSKDVAAVGGATVISGAIGGLPMIAEIVRSQANVMFGAKTRWSNFFHGCFMLTFVLLATQLIDHIPVAALAALLVITGYRLASPAVFKKTHAIGTEQTFIFCVTIITTLATDLLIGVATGVVVKLLMHLYHGAPITSLFTSKVDVLESPSDNYTVTVKGSAVFSNYIPLKNKLDRLARRARITVDLSQCKLVDHTVMDRLAGYTAEYQRNGGTFNVVGLDEHNTHSKHPLAMRRLLTAAS